MSHFVSLFRNLHSVLNPAPSMQRLAVAALLPLLLLVFPPKLPAQEITGTLSGTVTDSSGSGVPAAKITAIRQETGAARETTASDAGLFFFNSLGVGTYTVTVEKAGFKKYESSGIGLHVNDKVDLLIQLTVGEISEKIVVTGQTPLLQTESAELSTLIGSQQVLDLPLNGRDFNQLVDLVPGVAPDNGRVNSGVGLFSDTSVSVSGSQSNSNLFLVDGEYNLDSGGNGNLLVTPSVDSIEEFKILTSWMRPTHFLMQRIRRRAGCTRTIMASQQAARSGFPMSTIRSGPTTSFSFRLNGGTRVAATWCKILCQQCASGRAFSIPLAASRPMSPE
jgi:hypothetical protein